MRSLCFYLALCIALPAGAQELRIDHRSRPTSLLLNELGRLELPRLSETTRSPHTVRPFNKADFTLNCENDNQIDSGNTLALLSGTLAGSFLDPPATGVSYRVTDISIGLLDIGTSYPAEVSILILLYDGVQYFNTIGSFTATLTEPIAGGAEILNFDLTPFGLEIDDQLLALFGQSSHAGAPTLFPAADASPRCSLNETAQLCSVLLPGASNELWGYAFSDDSVCTGKDPTLLADVIVEIGVSDRIVAVEQGSFAALKARF
jgi:hypothetical protein